MESIAEAPDTFKIQHAQVDADLEFRILARLCLVGVTRGIILVLLPPPLNGMDHFEGSGRMPKGVFVFEACFEYTLQGVVEVLELIIGHLPHHAFHSSKGRGRE